MERISAKDFLVDFVTDVMTLRRYPQSRSLKSLNPIEEVYHQLRLTVASAFWRQGLSELFEETRKQTTQISDVVAETFDEEWWRR